jgi:hypothetical protein
MRKLCLLFAGVVMLAGVAAETIAADKKAYTPETTKVALLPVLNRSGEKWQELKDKQVTRAQQELTWEFQERGFAVIPTEAVTGAVKELGINLDDEEEYKRETLYKVGKKVGADLVAFVIITDTSQKVVSRVFVVQKHGIAKIKAWLVDAKAESPIFSAKVLEARSQTGVLAPGLQKGSDRQIQAAIDAVRDAFKEFMDSYTVTKTDIRPKK